MLLQNIYKLLASIGLLAIAFGAGYYVGHTHTGARPQAVRLVGDTIVVHDTVTKYLSEEGSFAGTQEPNDTFTFVIHPPQTKPDSLLEDTATTPLIGIKVPHFSYVRTLFFTPSTGSMDITYYHYRLTINAGIWLGNIGGIGLEAYLKTKSGWAGVCGIYWPGRPGQRGPAYRVGVVKRVYSWQW